MEDSIDDWVYSLSAVHTLPAEIEGNVVIVDITALS